VSIESLRCDCRPQILQICKLYNCNAIGSREADPPAFHHGLLSYHALPVSVNGASVTARKYVATETKAAHKTKILLSKGRWQSLIFDAR